MIEIIKNGKEKFNMTCHHCGCEYTYQIDDIKAGDVVPCPECKYRCVHPRQDQPVTINTPPFTPYNPLDYVNYYNCAKVDLVHRETQTK